MAGKIQKEPSVKVMTFSLSSMLSRRVQRGAIKLLIIAFPATEAAAQTPPRVIGRQLTSRQINRETKATRGPWYDGRGRGGNEDGREGHIIT